MIEFATAFLTHNLASCDAKYFHLDSGAAAVGLVIVLALFAAIINSDNNDEGRMA